MAERRSTTFGFARTDTLLKTRVRKASESRGFAQTRVLTHWDEIAGPDLAAVARPVEIRYGRGGLGATLVVLTTGAHAPMIEMQREAIRARINAIYGYNAIAKLRITQTAPTGFADGAVDFTHRKLESPPETPVIDDTARAAASGIADNSLREAIERLAANVISKTNP